MVPNSCIAVLVDAMQARVAEDLRDEGAEHTKQILEEVCALRHELESLRGLARI